MDAFEFFFSFYGLLLGFSAAELVGGFTRLLHQRKDIRFGLLTPMLAIFVAIDIATFWNQAWVILRFAPYSFALLILGLFVAGIFYVAATLTFPRKLEPGQSMDDHFWSQRRIVLLCVLSANLIMATLFMVVTNATGEFAAAIRPSLLWGLALFTVLTLVAAIARSKKVVIAALVILLAYHSYNIGRSVTALVATGGWSVRAPANPEADK
ncbi:hypothetical protein [Brevundimonas goettingensis]|uniref:Uncharacterized protein n=1 Tax=Brevundimonas goettingensis TaxID=2774190 RepID=A0A975C3C0_9CAUL|nr:hypothetical protein [Brevundimonas goettingensis]QTC93076.1 hypothetical protein IFJ75_09650 [Brevundimonas goettingensis]